MGGSETNYFHYFINQSWSCWKKLTSSDKEYKEKNLSNYNPSSRPNQTTSYAMNVINRSFKTIKMKSDSAATCHVLDHNNSPGIIIPHEPVIINSATKHQQRSVAKKLLPLHPKISMNANKAPTFASINSNLMSFPELCDDGCVCTLRKDNF